jgi:hypothetical protein
LVRLIRLAVAGLTKEDAAEIGGRDPVLILEGDEMVGDAEKALDGDGEADLFESFADGAFVKRFEVFEFTADDAPATGFRRILAKREENAVLVVEDEDAYADAGSEWRSRIGWRIHTLKTDRPGRDGAQQCCAPTT